MYQLYTIRGDGVTEDKTHRHKKRGHAKQRSFINRIKTRETKHALHSLASYKDREGDRPGVLPLGGEVHHTVMQCNNRTPKKINRCLSNEMIQNNTSMNSFLPHAEFLAFPAARCYSRECKIAINQVTPHSHTCPSMWSQNEMLRVYK